MSAYFLVALLVAGIVVVAVRYDDINATPDANSAAQMASNPITVFALVKTVALDERALASAQRT